MFIDCSTLEGVNILDKNSVYIQKGVIIGKNVTIYPNNILLEGCIIEDNVKLLPNNFISDSTVKSGASVFYSVIESSVVKEDATIGPFSHLRPNSIIEEKAKIGNFVEIKNSTIGQQTKVSHLSYVGDASVGKKVNIGCGVVFVNYNGKQKNKTIIEDNSFIGSSVNLIAPVKVEQDCFICAGTTVDKDVSKGDFVIGRSRMTIKKDRAYKYLRSN